MIYPLKLVVARECDDCSTIIVSTGRSHGANEFFHGFAFKT